MSDVPHLRDYQPNVNIGRHAFLTGAQIPLQRRGIIEGTPKHTFGHRQ
jgi:hypothetical protein